MLWPFTLKEAALRLDKLTIWADRCSNEASFFRIVGDIIDIKIFHTFGCPIFVLDARCQSGISAVPKWEPRSRLGIYVGHSPVHAGTIALILNPRTGHVSPQYHVVFDDQYTTLPFMNKGHVPPNPADLVVSSHKIITDERYDLAKTWLWRTSLIKHSPNQRIL